jgi:hypothetical protein
MEKTVEKNASACTCGCAKGGCRGNPCTCKNCSC